jgi:murein DD-endopeptidase MepM/ murein hydrolase activator NlpD
MLKHFARILVANLSAVVGCFILSGNAQACVADVSPTPEAPNFSHPAPTKIETPFGPRFHPLLNARRHHDGIDYVAKIADPVQAAASGEVVSSGDKGEHGIAIEVRHHAEWTTLYAHLHWPYVRTGACVKAGDVIGASGNTGFSIGPHLHFEIRQKGRIVDPTSLLDMSGRD